MLRVFAFLSSLLLLGVSLFAWSILAPGFGYDEAWLGLFAHRIATDSSFRPWIGMSHYTMALCQYITALVFHLFGTSIAAYRAVGKIEILLGVSLISSALAVLGEGLAAAILPAVIAFFPALIINQRWVVELTTFSVLCFGWTVLGLVLRWKRGPSFLCYFIISTGIVLGVSSHVMLFASIFPLWYCLYVTDSLPLRWDKITSSILLIFSAIFFSFIYFLDKSHKEIFAAIALVCLASGITWIPFPKKLKKPALLIPSILGTVLLLPFLVYIEGNWLAKQFNGLIENSLWIGFIFVPILILIYGLIRKGKTSWKFFCSPAGYTYLALTLLMTYSMVGRVGARFLEIPMLYFGVVLTLGFVRLPMRLRAVVGFLWVLVGSGVLWQNYLQPSVEERQIALTYRLGKWMKECSEDFLPKVNLVRRLSNEGCRLNNLEPSSRWIELQFMSQGDWPKPRQETCRLGNSIEIQKSQFLTSKGRSGSPANPLSTQYIIKTHPD